MVEEPKAEPERAATEPAAKDPEPEKKKKKGGSGGDDKVLGKFTHGDHMVHVLFQKGKKFIPLCADDR